MARATLVALSLLLLAGAAAAQPVVKKVAAAKKTVAGKKVAAKKVAAKKVAAKKVAAPKPLWNSYDFGYTSSYYGGQTDGGSCGYGEAATSVYGVYTASASSSLYRNGLSCGACLKIACVGSRRCLAGTTSIVTVSNLCPPKSSGGWCASGKKSYSLAPLTWNQIAVDPNFGVVPVKATRVPCVRTGGITFKVIVGNPYYFEVLISNVAGSGDLAKVEVAVARPDKRVIWQNMKHAYGAVWSFSGVALVGFDISFRMTTGYFPETVTCVNSVPAFYETDFTYTCKKNFVLAATPKRSVLEEADEEVWNANITIRAGESLPEHLFIAP